MGVSTSHSFAVNGEPKQCKQCPRNKIKSPLTLRLYQPITHTFQFVRSRVGTSSGHKSPLLSGTRLWITRSTIWYGISLFVGRDFSCLFLYKVTSRLTVTPPTYLGLQSYSHGISIQNFLLIFEWSFFPQTRFPLIVLTTGTRVCGLTTP